MKSFTFAAAAVLLGAAQVLALGPIVYQGCYSATDGLSFHDHYIYQSKGYCQGECAPSNLVMATANATECWCGSALPPASSKVDDTKCSSPCSGFGQEQCGGDGFYSVYLTGVAGTVSGAAVSDTAPSSNPSQTTSAKPSVITVGGQTVVVTATNSANPSGSASSGGGPSKTGIAAGVVVGVVAIGAIAGGLFLFLRHRKRRQVEEEYRRNVAVSSFINGGKPPTSSGGSSSFTDMRLDPVMAQRRMSDGSIADNQDYSRRILKVTNA